MAFLQPKDVQSLKIFIEKIEEEPQLLHEPSLRFFKDYLVGMGATIPQPTKTENGNHTPSSPKKESTTPASAPPVEESSSEEEPEEPEEPEEADPLLIEKDEAPFPETGEVGKEVDLTDEQLDKQGDTKQAATDALEDGDLPKALSKYTEAILIGNASAMMFAKRAEISLKMKKPCACINDCDAALQVNPDSAKAFRIRGTAYRLIGEYEKAFNDISKAQQFDYDDTLDGMQKFLNDKHKKNDEKKVRQRLRDEQKKAKEMKKRKEAAKKAYEAQKEAEKNADGGFPFGGMGGMPGGMGGMPGGMGGMPGGMGGMPGGMGGMPGGMGGMPGGMGGMPGGLDPSMLGSLMSDPELLQALNNPKMAAAMQDIMSNPASMAKYQNDPEIMALFQKLMGKMGGMGMPGGMPGGGMGSNAGPTVEEVHEKAGVDSVD